MKPAWLRTPTSLPSTSSNLATISASPWAAAWCSAVLPETSMPLISGAGSLSSSSSRSPRSPCAAASQNICCVVRSSSLRFES